MPDAWTVNADMAVGADVADASTLDELVAAEASRLEGADSVAVIAHPRLQTIVTVLGALRAGVPVVPISPDAGPVEREHLVRDSGAALVVDGDDREQPAAPREVPIPPDTALLMYTSGTTGLPKGVPVSTGAITACLDGLADAWAWTPDDVLVHGLPLHHVHGLVLGVLGPVHVGSALRHTGRPTPEAYAQAGGSLYFGVPTVWSRIAHDTSAARALTSARLLVSGSAALASSVAQSLVALCGQAPVERYGMTETLITVSARADEPRVVGSVGRPLTGTDTRVVDDAGRPVAAGTVGHLEVRGPSVFAGYLGRQEATATAFTDDGWFRTGDAASIDASGLHRLIGRTSTDLIKSGGFRIGAGEVEETLATFPGVRESAVVGIPDDDLGQRVVAFVVGDDIAPQQLIDHVAEQLSWHKRPREIVRLDALPRNAMGKVEKVALRDAYLAGD